MEEIHAEAVLRRFENVIRNVSQGVAQTFAFLTELDDVTQEARILVLSYAGLVPGGRLPNELANVEAKATGDESRIKGLIANQLRLDLNQNYGREADKRMSTQSLSELSDNHSHAAFTDRLSEDIKPSTYPYLHAHYVRGWTGAEIAETAGVGRSTVTRRIAAEKHAFVKDYVKRSGLRLEGDETTDELIEAYLNLKSAGR